MPKCGIWRKMAFENISNLHLKFTSSFCILNTGLEITGQWRKL
jgi:hypothetical protein